MSYAAARERVESAPKNEPDKTRCPAYGCPCRATVSAGSGWLCRYHVDALSETWQEVTRLVRESDWLTSLIADVRKMVNAGQPWREFACRFWDADPDGAPAAYEDAGAYLYRLELEMLWRCKQTSRRPLPMPNDQKLAKFLHGVRRRA
jgi:hypothetical protein